MKIEIILASSENGFIIKNMYPLWEYPKDCVNL